MTSKVELTNSSKNEVKVELVQGRTALTKCASQFPLRILRLESWKGYMSLSLVGFGGGMVAGDSVNVSVEVDEGAKLSIRTVGSTNVFKASQELLCKQNLYAKVAANALLAFIPDPNCCYESSVFHQEQIYHVANGGSAVVVDWSTSGRKGRDAFWGAREIRNRLIVYEDRELVLFENQELRNDQHGLIRDKMGSANVFGFVILTGPKTKGIRKDVRCLAQRRSFKDTKAEILYQSHSGNYSTNINTNSTVDSENSLPLVSAAHLSDETCLVRFTAPSVEYGYVFLQELLSPLAAELDNSAPYADRIHYDLSNVIYEHPHDPINSLRAMRAQEMEVI